MHLENRKVLVVGFGKTGDALCRFLLKKGARVTVTDKKSKEAMGKKALAWEDKGVRFEAGGHNPETFLQAELIIPSPGVPLLPEIEAARARGIAVISEIELAHEFLRGLIIGITGSNGKSTTTTLIHRILKDAGRRAFLAGNIGKPLILFADGSRPGDIYVTEISSFQLEHIRDFKVHISLFLNISSNHLDWHKSFENYYAAKKKLLLPQTADDIGILNRDDRLVWAMKREGKFKAYAFSRTKPVVARGAFLRDGWIVIRDREEKRVMPVGEIPLPGLHNQENVMAAVVAGHVCGASPAGMRRTVKAFKGLEHRLEDVLTWKGVRFVNDSKATTVDATVKALDSFDRKVVLILGGRDKGGDFTGLRPAVKEKARKVLLIGEARDKIAAALQGSVPMETGSTFRELVRKGFAAARPGDVVLLAPACTSWDMFKSFEERGRVFKREVGNLAKTSKERKS